jgi:hypothetical protein
LIMWRTNYLPAKDKLKYPTECFNLQVKFRAYSIPP